MSQGLFQCDLDAAGVIPWMGFRPSLPDSLPVIDQVCKGRVLLAFGHQHPGLTQAAITAQWLGHRVQGEHVAQLAAYRLDRF